MSTAGTPSPRDAARRRRTRTARRWLWRGRWVLVAVCCGIAASATVQALRPAAPATASVVVPARTLDAGAQIERTDLTVATVPAALVPHGALVDPADAVGRVPAVTLEAGWPLSASLVAGGEVAALAPRGTVVVPVRLDDATAALLRAGDHVDLVSTAPIDPDAAYLARRALVLPTAARDAPASTTSPLAAVTPHDTPEPVTLVAVAPEEAPAISAASGASVLAAVLVP